MFVSLSGAGCFDHADRVHPFDPRSPEFENFGGVTGIVSGIYAPFLPIQGAEVRFRELRTSTTPNPMQLHFSSTNADGSFSFDLPAGEYAFSVEKEKYLSFQDTLRVQAGVSEEKSVTLSGLPYFENVQLASAHISQWWPPPLEQFFIEFNVQAGDIDGVTDISKTWVEVPDLAFADTLVETGTPGNFTKILSQPDLPGISMSALVGRAVSFHVIDRTGNEYVSTPHFISRIIDHTPNPIRPSGLALLSESQPQLSWEASALPFAFRYRIDVVKVQANIQTVEQTIRDIPSDSLNWTITEPLTAGEYFWTVSVVDELGNRSRSREAGFRIE